MKFMITVILTVLLCFPAHASENETELEPIVAAAIDLCVCAKVKKVRGKRRCVKYKELTETQVERLVRAREIEKEMNYPHRARGLLLASMCIESNNTTNARGDYRPFVYFVNSRGKKGKRQCKPHRERYVKGKKCKPRAIGILQFWPWAKKRIRPYLPKRTPPKYRKDPRLHWEAAAKYWSKNFLKQAKWTKKHCKYTKWRYKGTSKRRFLFGSKEAKALAAAEARAVRYPKGSRCNEYTSHWRRMNRMQRRAKLYE